MTDTEKKELKRIADRAESASRSIQGIPIYFNVCMTLIDIEQDIKRLIR